MSKFLVGVVLAMGLALFVLFGKVGGLTTERDQAQAYGTRVSLEKAVVELDLIEARADAAELEHVLELRNINLKEISATADAQRAYIMELDNDQQAQSFLDCPMPQSVSCLFNDNDPAAMQAGDCVQIPTVQTTATNTNASL